MILLFLRRLAFFMLLKMRLQDRLCVLTIMLTLVFLGFFINRSKLKEVAKRSNDVEIHCDNPGLFESHFGCCPHKKCPVDHFPFHIHSGAADVVAAKICINNTVIMGDVTNNAGEGLNIVLASGRTGQVLRNNYFNVDSDPGELLDFLKTLKPGNIILVASHMDPTPQLTDEIRDVFTGLGSTMVKSLKPRDSWVFAGAYGGNHTSLFEKFVQNDMENNAYGDWPEMGEIVGCFPRITETE